MLKEPQTNLDGKYNIPAKRFLWSGENVKCRIAQDKQRKISHKA